MPIYQQLITLQIGLSCIHLNLVEKVHKAQRFIQLVIILDLREFVRYIHLRKPEDFCKIIYLDLVYTPHTSLIINRKIATAFD